MIQNVKGYKKHDKIAYSSCNIKIGQISSIKIQFSKKNPSNLLEM